jgi:hypothetical protein
MWSITGRCLKWYGDYVEMQMPGLLFLTVLDIYVKGINISVTHPQIIFTEQPTNTK